MKQLEKITVEFKHGPKDGATETYVANTLHSGAIAGVGGCYVYAALPASPPLPSRIVAVWHWSDKP